LGRFQAANAALAVTTVRELERQGFPVGQDAYLAGIERARIPGRCEIMQQRPRVILDGAHNPEKVRAFVTALPLLAHRPAGGRIICVLGMLESKDHRDMIGALAPVVDDLILTTPRVLAKAGLPAAVLADDARNAGFAGTVFASEDPKQALQRALAVSRPERGDVVVVTGSLYLVGYLRGQWYANEDVLLQRTQWPQSEADEPSARA
jgi:dihydrofolate synthase/folylpolyglutamate synthase